MCCRNKRNDGKTKRSAYWLRSWDGEATLESRQTNSSEGSHAFGNSGFRPRWNSARWRRDFPQIGRRHRQVRKIIVQIPKYRNEFLTLANYTIPYEKN